MENGVQKHSAPEEGTALSKGASAQLDEGETSDQAGFRSWRYTDQQNPIRQYAWTQTACAGSCLHLLWRFVCF